MQAHIVLLLLPGMEYSIMCLMAKATSGREERLGTGVFRKDRETEGEGGNYHCYGGLRGGEEHGFKNFGGKFAL